MLIRYLQQPAIVARATALLLCVPFLAACPSNSKPAAAAWVGWVENGDKPGIGYAFTEDPTSPVGYVYVIDPNTPGDFSKSMRARMEDLQVAPEAVRFNVRFPGVPPKALSLEFRQGRAGEAATAHLTDTDETIPFKRGTIPNAMGDYEAIAAEADKQSTWEGVPEKPTDPWGMRIQVRGEKVIAGTLYVFDPKFPRDFARAYATPMTFDGDDQSVLTMSFEAIGAAGERMKMFYDAGDWGRGKSSGSLGLRSPDGDRFVGSERISLRRE